MYNFKSASVRRTRYYIINYNDNYFRILKNKYQLEKRLGISKNK